MAIHFVIIRNMENTTPPPAHVVAAAGFAALGSEQRLSVLVTLVRAGPEGLPIGVLGDRTGITGSTLTHHMRVLAQAGLVQRARDGRRILCVADYDGVRALSDFLLSQCCRDSDDAVAAAQGSLADD